MKTKVKGINLLPNEYIVAEKINFYKKVVAIVLAVEVACFIAFIVIPPKQEVQRTAETLAAKQKELTSERYAGVNKTLNELEQAKNEMQTWVTEYSKIKIDNYIDGQLLDELVARVPNGVSIDIMDINAPVPNEDGSCTKIITLNGTSDTFEGAINYESILETLYPTSTIEPIITYGEDNTYIYTMTITLITEPVVTTEVAEGTTEGAEANASSEQGEGAEN